MHLPRRQRGLLWSRRSWTRSTRRPSGLLPFESGWLSRYSASVGVHHDAAAQLTIATRAPCGREPLLVLPEADRHSELDDAHDEQEQWKQDQRELDDHLALLAAEVRGRLRRSSARRLQAFSILLPRVYLVGGELARMVASPRRVTPAHSDLVCRVWSSERKLMRDSSLTVTGSPLPVPSGLQITGSVVRATPASSASQRR